MGNYWLQREEQEDRKVVHDFIWGPHTKSTQYECDGINAVEAVVREFLPPDLTWMQSPYDLQWVATHIQCKMDVLVANRTIHSYKVEITDPLMPNIRVWFQVFPGVKVLYFDTSNLLSFLGKKGLVGCGAKYNQVNNALCNATV
jgi:hypothetical protein